MELTKEEYAEQLDELGLFKNSSHNNRRRYWITDASPVKDWESVRHGNAPYLTLGSDYYTTNNDCEDDWIDLVRVRIFDKDGDVMEDSEIYVCGKSDTDRVGSYTKRQTYVDALRVIASFKVKLQMYCDAELEKESHYARAEQI